MPVIDLGQDTSATAHPSLAPIGGAPIDPSIVLHLNQAQPGGGLGQLGDYADVMTKLTAAKTAQQTYAARVKAGQILASSPNLESGMDALFADPSVAPFAGEITNSIRQSMLAQTQQAGAQQEQALNAWDAVKKGLPAVLADPSDATWKAATGPALAGMSPSARAQMAPALESLRGSLLDGLPNDPVARKQMVQVRLAGLTGANPDVMHLAFGTPGSVDQGNKIQPTMTSQVTGQQAPVGNSFNKSLAPQVVTGTDEQGRAITRVIGGGGGSSSGGSSHGAGGNIFTGPDQTTSQYNTKRADDIVDYEKSLDDRVGNGATLRKNAGEVINAASQAQLGGGSEAFMKLGQALQAIGVSTPTVDNWSKGNLAAVQVANKLSMQDSMSQLKQQLTGVGGSRLNAQEFVAYMNNNPNITTDPRAMKEIFNLWQNFYDRDKTEQRAFDSFKQGKPTGDSTLDHLASGNALTGGKPDIKSWPALWNQSDYMNKFAPSGEFDTSKVKGLPQQHPADIQDLLKKYQKK